MAEAVISPLVDVLIGGLASALQEEVGLIRGVDKELDNLKRMLSMIRCMLADAEERQITEGAIKIWLAELKDVAYDADDLLDEFAYEALRRKFMEADHETKKRVCNLFLSCCLLSPIRFRRTVAHKIKEINNRVDRISRDGETCRLEIRRIPDINIIEQRPPSSSMIAKDSESDFFGRDDDMKQIMDLLLSDEDASGGGKDVSVISIVGMGGLGKTTLAQLVYNNENVQKHFQVTAWVCVSDQFDILRLTREIIESATRGSCDSSAFDSMQGKLQQILSAKRFLIVLDDVWNTQRSSWDKLRTPFSFGAKGSKIIVTTRNEDISRNMDIDRSYPLKLLSDDVCLLLFKRHAFAGDQDSNAFPELMEIGKDLVEKRCQGLPLAANALGGLLSARRDVNFWKSILNSKLWSSMEDEIDVMKVLRVSYHHLPPHIKQCFSFCSIFPKDYVFIKDDLVKLWMAQGFIKLTVGMTLEDTGSGYFDFLLSRSFFQREENHRRYKMHDCIHDLAESISSEECLRIERGKPTHMTKKGHRHSSFIIMGEDTETVNLEDLYTCKGLRTFILQGNHGKKGNVDDLGLSDLIVNLRCLRVLVLKKSWITELPGSICNLKHLRYLDLSLTDITQLPESVSSLYNLQTLKLGYCWKLRQLPKETRKLLNLRHLYLDGCRSLEGMPSEIGGLTCLRTLSRFVVGRESGSRIGELKGLMELRGAISIEKLQNVSDVDEAQEANLRNKALIDELELSWGGEEVAGINSQDQASFEELEQILGALQPHKDIKGLKINGYRGNTYPSWLQDSMLPNLASFSLKGCTNFSVLPPLGRFHMLKSLHVEDMHGVNRMGREFYGEEGTNRFPSLKDLRINGIPNLEEWCEVEGGEFPCLIHISIFYCPKLMKMPSIFSTIKHLSLVYCPQLGCLPRLPSLDILRLRDCNEILLRCISDLTSLSELEITYFGELRSLPEGMLRPLGNLKKLEISKCGKLVCLVEGDKGLPPTLTSLKISYCYNLKSLPKGLQSLTNLKEITIGGCPELFSLPEEGLPGTLEYLCIFGCEKLRERCRKEDGEDWAKISHIPRVRII